MNDQKINLAIEACERNSNDIAPMPMAEAMKLIKNLHEGWSVNSVGHLERALLTKDFLSSLGLSVLIGKVAQEARYYPDLLIQNGLVRVEIWTRPINGLSRSDFVLAAKIDLAIKEEESSHV